MHTNQKISKACEYLTQSHNADFASEYGEPGYATPERGIIFANWNDIPKGLADWLEKCGFALEWSDEWMVDYEHGKAYRTSPDSYGWECSVMLPPDSCEYLTPDDAPSEWVEACQITANGQPIHALPSRITPEDLSESGFTLQASDLESGLHAGMNDNPQEIARELFKRGAYRVAFRKTENSQFYCRFEVYADFGDDASEGPNDE